MPQATLVGAKNSLLGWLQAEKRDHHKTIIYKKEVLAAGLVSSTSFSSLDT